MENLGASFLVDLEDLSDYEKDKQHLEEVVINTNDLDSVSKLQRSQAYIHVMNKVEEALLKGSASDKDDVQLIVNEVNQLWVDIENEIAIIHSFIRDKYRPKFPELESLVYHPIDYAHVVKKMIREENLLDLLPPAIVMVIFILTASTSSSSSKPDDDTLDQNEIIIHEACDRAVTLDASKLRLVEFFESRMSYIAPNLSAIVGSVVAAKLLGTAGGLSSLAKMPACNVLLLGAKKNNLAGFSSSTAPRVGYLEETYVFQTTPPALKMHACRLLAAKATLAARVDCIGGDPSGTQGRTYLEEILKKIDKLQEPPPARHSKLLRIHISEPKKKRGGRRLHKMKERYVMTEVRKRANRMEFGVPEDATLLGI